MTTETPELLAVLDALRSSSANLLIHACAGGGKTHTLVQLAKTLGPGRRIIALTFNKEAAESLERRMPYFVQSTTFHSLCFSALRVALGFSPKVDGNKTKWILKDLVPNWSERREVEEAVLTLVSRFKSTAACSQCEKELAAVADRFNIDADGRTLSLARQVLDKCEASPFSSIDFDDMLWLTLRLNVTFPSTAFVFLDEAQDTNGVQRALLARILGVGNPIIEGDFIATNATRSRLIAVGDPHQSIYGFRGADSDAMAALQRDFNMTSLPLSVSWRCSQSVVKEAQKYL